MAGRNVRHMVVIKTGGIAELSVYVSIMVEEAALLSSCQSLTESAALTSLYFFSAFFFPQKIPNVQSNRLNDSPNMEKLRTTTHRKVHSRGEQSVNLLTVKPKCDAINLKKKEKIFLRAATGRPLRAKITLFGTNLSFCVSPSKTILAALVQD